jgi:hypothetical protein
MFDNMPDIRCDDCGAALHAESVQSRDTGPPPMTTDFDCACGARWSALANGTKWRRFLANPPRE